MIAKPNGCGFAKAETALTSTPVGRERSLVVVVDDQTTGRKIVEQLVCQVDDDIDVVGFADGASAIEFMLSTTPDLILTDYIMPEMDGITFIRRVRAIPGCHETPIIVVTVAEDKRVRYDALDAGATDFLNRPIDQRECRTRCRNLLTLSRQQQTIRHRAKLLEDSERRFRIMADELPLAIWVQGADTAVSFVNKTCCQYFGVSEGEIAGQGWRSLVHREDRARYFAALSQSCRERTPFHDQCRMRRADGQWRWLEFIARPFFGADDAFAGMVGHSSDITERKAADEALRQSHQELQRHAERLAHLTSQLALAEQRERERLAIVLHDDLQQLLVGAALGIEGFSRRFDAQTQDAGSREALVRVADLLQQAIGSARSLVADLSPPILHDAGLPEALEWLARSMLDRYGLRVALSIDSEAAPVRADVRSVVFASVREALFNAFKHAGCSDARVTLSRVDDQLLLVIEDQGSGFDTERLFNEGPNGNGFGLMSMRERLQLLGGEFGIESRPGEGTRVTLRAPVHAERDDLRLFARAKAGDPRACTEADAVPPRADAPIRILLVDDHAMMRQGLASLLCEEPDLDVVGEAANGREAIEQAALLAPDVVLMDYSMPDMTGLEATRRIKERWPGICIVGLSMYEEADRAGAMLAAGASAYLAKSGDTDALLEAIRNARIGDSVD